MKKRESEKVILMNQDPINRGARLKAYRKERRMTLKQLSEETGLSVGFLSKIENGFGNPSINNIQKICYALEITVNDLMLSKTEDELLENVNRGKSYVVRQDERCLLYDFSGVVRFECLYEGNPNFSLNVLTLNGDTSNCFSSTHAHDEIGIIAKGKLKAVLSGDQEYILEEGDMILIRAQTTHTLSSATDDSCISYWFEIKSKKTQQTVE